jgi:hypothetical protein
MNANSGNKLLITSQNIRKIERKLLTDLMNKCR